MDYGCRILKGKGFIREAKMIAKLQRGVLPFKIAGTKSF
jgi:hypothetical protein